MNSSCALKFPNSFERPIAALDLSICAHEEQVVKTKQKQIIRPSLAKALIKVILNWIWWQKPTILSLGCLIDGSQI